MFLKLPNDHDNPTDSQLIIALTGKPNQIRKKLIEIIDELDSKHGKPCQGLIVSYDIKTSVLTPCWDGKKY